MKKIAILLVSILFVSQSFASEMDELTESWTRSSSASGRIGNETTEMESEDGDMFILNSPVSDSVWILLFLAGGACLLRKREIRDKS